MSAQAKRERRKARRASTTLVLDHSRFTALPVPMLQVSSVAGRTVDIRVLEIVEVPDA